MNVIILLGPPGSGKGTIAEALIGYNVTHISTGQMLRKEIRLGSKIGMRSKEAINNGFFADDDDVVSMVTDFDCWHPKHDSVTVDQIIRTMNQNSNNAFKLIEEFSKIDEEVMEIMRVQAGSALANSLLHAQLVKSKERVDAMIGIICLMNRDLGINSLLFTISSKAHSLMEADKCTLYMVDHPNEQMWTIQGQVNLRFSMGKGIAGYVATKGETINLVDPYNDPRFDQTQDKKSNKFHDFRKIVEIIG